MTSPTLPVPTAEGLGTDSPLRTDRMAAGLGVALGVCFTVCFATGMLSHLIQDPPSWFLWPTRPVGLYRVTQGLHVATGLGLIPILLAKLWVVYPKLFRFPPATSVGDAVSRLGDALLVGGGLFLVFSGTANLARWRPWGFGFTAGHYWTALLAYGALLVHVAHKAATTRQELRGPLRALAARFLPGRAPDDGVGAAGADAPEAADEAAGAGADGDAAAATGEDSPAPTATDEDAPVPTDARGPHALTRRGFLGAVALASAAITVTTVGQTAPWFRRLNLLGPRRSDVGPQGVPVNTPAAGAGVEEAVTSDAALADYRLTVTGAVDRELELTLDDLRAMPQHSEDLPIACVEGWSADARWTGVRVRDLLERAGARDGAEVTVVSLQDPSLYASSELNRLQAADDKTLLALRLHDEPLHADHGRPVRLIGANRPGVQQTKWVTRLEVR